MAYLVLGLVTASAMAILVKVAVSVTIILNSIIIVATFRPKSSSPWVAIATILLIFLRILIVQ